MALDEVDVGIELGSAALLKIDVEGWEPHALRGGKKVLSSVRRVIIEVNRPSLEMAGSSAEEVFDLLRAAGFTDFLRIVQRFPRRYIPSDVFNVLAVRPSDQINGVLGSRRRLVDASCQCRLAKESNGVRVVVARGRAAMRASGEESETPSPPERTCCSLDRICG